MKKKLFIIEDDAVILYTLRAKFSSEGLIVEVDNGSNSVMVLMSQLKNYKPDFVILDLMLPQVEGTEVLRAIKSEDSLKNTKVMIYTSMSDKDTKEQCETLGADYFFTKSEFNNIDEFAEKINKIIKNKNK